MSAFFQRGKPSSQNYYLCFCEKLCYSYSLNLNLTKKISIQLKQK